MRWVSLLTIVALVLAGCSGAKPSSTTNPTPTSTCTGASCPTTPTGPKPVPAAISLQPDTLRANAPANITFTIQASGPVGGGKYALDFGDQTAKSSGTVPSDASQFSLDIPHMYAKDGTFTANYRFDYKDGKTLQKNQTLLIVPAGQPLVPAALIRHWNGTMAFNMVFAYVGEDEVAMKTAHMHPEANQTFVVWYDFQVEPGAQSLAIDTIPRSDTTVDVDILIELPDGTFQGGTNDGDASEQYTLEVPEPGTYTVFDILFTGAQGAIQTDLSVTYA
jgi:hypothetical protein